MDKLRAMTSFVRIVDRGSLTAAAADLGVSLPAMVRTLALLEGELGTTLLNRTTRRIHLTDDGRQYLERCRTILAQVHDAEAALHSHRAAPHGRLAITAPVLFGQRYVAPLMSEFLRRYREVSGELLFVDRVVNLVEKVSTPPCASAVFPTPRSSRFQWAECGAWSAPALNTCALMVFPAGRKICAPRLRELHRSDATCGVDIPLAPAQGRPAQRPDLQSGRHRARSLR